jgi:hypothetical protein
MGRSLAKAAFETARHKPWVQGCLPLVTRGAGAIGTGALLHTVEVWGNQQLKRLRETGRPDSISRVEHG